MKALTAALAALTAVLTACAPTPAPRTAVVEVGPVLQFQVEVANTEQTQRAGLAGRTLSEGTGMLFPFAEREERQVDEAHGSILGRVGDSPTSYPEGGTSGGGPRAMLRPCHDAVRCWPWSRRAGRAPAWTC